MLFQTDPTFCWSWAVIEVSDVPLYYSGPTSQVQDVQISGGGPAAAQGASASLLGQWRTRVGGRVGLSLQACEADVRLKVCSKAVTTAAVCKMSDGDFYVRYYVGHKGKFGHEFLEFEFRPDGKVPSYLAGPYPCQC